MFARQLAVRAKAVAVFQDEESHKLDVPAQSEYDNWLAAVRKKFKKLYRIELDDWIDETTADRPARLT